MWVHEKKSYKCYLLRSMQLNFVEQGTGVGSRPLVNINIILFLWELNKFSYIQTILEVNSVLPRNF